MIELKLSDIKDYNTRKSFELLVGLLDRQVILSGDMTLFTLTFTSAVTNFKYPHKLTFTPKDVIPTSTTGAGTLTFNYSKFDATNLDITTTGACVVRCLIGRLD
jgi:hypothetical protein